MLETGKTSSSVSSIEDSDLQEQSHYTSNLVKADTNNMDELELHQTILCQAQSRTKSLISPHFIKDLEAQEFEVRRDS